MLKSVLFAGAMSFLLSTGVLARNPQGEAANYRLDRNRDRTSSLIQKGSIVLSAGALKPKAGTNGSYPTTLAYDIKALFAGHLKGSKLFEVPSEFFTPEFMVRLRAEGEIDEGFFKIQHLGIEDVDTIFGVSYPACDKVRIYDVKTGKVPSFESLISETLGQIYMAQLEDPSLEHSFASIKNLELILDVSRLVSVLGAVKINASAVVSGFEIKIGFDYLAAVPVSERLDIEQ